jgi:GDP-4-dehydro-6-deoxy-D-mannose reductase
VHDVVAAYDLLLSKGRRGEVYNVCSGTGRTIREIITLLSDMTGIDAGVHQELAQIRPIDNPCIIGSSEKIRRELGWKPSVSFDQSLRSVYEYWDHRIRQEGAPGNN